MPTLATEGSDDVRIAAATRMADYHDADGARALARVALSGRSGIARAQAARLLAARVVGDLPFEAGNDESVTITNWIARLKWDAAAGRFVATGE
jgi:hypothetical protein